MSTSREPLSQSDWHDLQHQISELFDITLRYAEVVASESDRIWDKDRPKFFNRPDVPIDKSLALYQSKLAEFEEERKKAYKETFSKLKADGFERVVIVEKFIERLAAMTGVDFHPVSNTKLKE